MTGILQSYYSVLGSMPHEVCGSVNYAERERERDSSYTEYKAFPPTYVTTGSKIVCIQDEELKVIWIVLLTNLELKSYATCLRVSLTKYSCTYF